MEGLKIGPGVLIAKGAKMPITVKYGKKSESKKSTDTDHVKSKDFARDVAVKDKFESK